MRDRRGLLLAAGLGAGLAHWLDPDLGHARRVRQRERIGRAARRLRRGLAALEWRAALRCQGFLAEGLRALDLATPPDHVLVERVRSRLGHLVRHASRVEVTAVDGHVELAGTVLPGEAARALAGVRQVPGVREARGRLEERDEWFDLVAPADKPGRADGPLPQGARP